MKSPRECCRAPVALALLVAGTCPAWAQAPDFDVANLVVCNVSTSPEVLRWSVEAGYTPDFLTNPPEITVPLRIEIIGPNNTAVDDQVLQWFKPVDIGTCAGVQNCTGTCNKWIVKVLKNNVQQGVFEVPADCLLTAANCQCVPARPKVNKEKPKPDGPGVTHLVRVTIDPDNIFLELDESNNTLEFLLEPDGPICAAIPATSSTGLLLMLTALGAVGAWVLLRRTNA